MSLRAVLELKATALGPKRTMLPGQRSAFSSGHLLCPISLFPLPPSLRLPFLFPRLRHIHSSSLPGPRSAGKRTVSLVQPPELQVPVALPGVVQLVGIRDLGEERARVLGQRVKRRPIHNQAEHLSRSSPSAVHFPHLVLSSGAWSCAQKEPWRTSSRRQGPRPAGPRDRASSAPCRRQAPCQESCRVVSEAGVTAGALLSPSQATGPEARQKYESTGPPTNGWRGWMGRKAARMNNDARVTQFGSFIERRLRPGDKRLSPHPLSPRPSGE